MRMAYLAPERGGQLRIDDIAAYSIIAARCCDDWPIGDLGGSRNVFGQGRSNDCDRCSLGCLAGDSDRLLRLTAASFVESKGSEERARIGFGDSTWLPIYDFTNAG